MSTMTLVQPKAGTWSGASPVLLASRRLNVGCGQWPLRGWTNLDSDNTSPADVVATVPPLPYPDEALDDIYAGHVIEHMTPEDADVFLRECYRCVTPGGRLGVVVPDTREIMARYLAGSADTIEYPYDTHHPVADLDEVCALFLYSTVQASRHQWSYDLVTLRRRLERAGFTVTKEIDRINDPRLGTGQWYQCGLDARKPCG